MSEVSRGAAAARLFLLGFLTLFLELTLIRYLGGSVWNLSYFPNLVLMAAFVGMGMGFVFHPWVSERGSARLFGAAAFGLLALVLAISVVPPVVPGFDRWGGEIGGELYFTATPVESSAASLWQFGFWFVAVLVVFAFVAQRTAKVFRLLPPLRAYTFDIAGSVAGILAFMLASWAQLPAWAWLVATAPLFVAAADARVSWAWRCAPVVPLAIVGVLAYGQDRHLMSDPTYDGPLSVSWSPYQKVEYVDGARDPRSIYVNGVSHQVMLTGDLIRAAFYQLPHEHRRRVGLGPYRNVLVIGAGSGNDVASALANGAEHVDAAEIDPVIAQLGRLHHPARPYDDPRVSVIVDDARAVMTRATRKYDLIVFALTDSLVKVSSMAQLRLENYLFTEDSIRRAYRLLAENGDIVLYNHYRRPWLIEKFQRMIHAATGKYPLLLHQRGDFYVLLVGRMHGTDRAPRFLHGDLPIATDDWPFPYLQWRGIPSLYLYALAGLGALILLLMVLLQLSERRQRSTGRVAPLPTKLAFVFMGVAFLLLETKSIVQFSLLFGTTWLNTSLVLLAVLALVLAANWAAPAMRGPRALPVIYALLLMSCLITLFYPLRHLLALESPLLRFVLAAVLTFSPIFFANLIFSLSFRDQTVPEQLFGWNLLGATAGGIVEYLSMAIGYNGLALIVAGSYTVVFGLLVLGRRTGGARVAAL
jgi:hypothetical protein